MRLKLRLLAASTLLLAAMAGAERAGACVCSDIDERVRLASGEVGLIGRIVDRIERRDDVGLTHYEYRVRVRRSVGAKLDREVTVFAPEDGCGAGRIAVGDTLAGFPTRSGRDWTIDGCSVVNALEFRRALRPFPRARGRGRLRLLAGGSFGTARLMVLDGKGRILGYGFGGGEVREISVCPGGAYAAELVAERRRLSVAVRDLRSLTVVRSSTLAVRADRVDQETVHCNDPLAVSVRAAVHTYIRRRERVRIFDTAAPQAEQVVSLRAYGVLLGGSAAYVNGPGGLFSLDYANGSGRQLADVRFPEVLSLSPDAQRLVIYSDLRLTIIDLATGAERSKGVRSGYMSRWLSADRFFFRVAGEARIYDTDLNVVRRYPFYRLLGEAVVRNRVFGTDRFRLRALHMPSGRRRTVSTLPARGVIDLEGVADGPMMEASNRAPRLGYRVLRPRSE